VTGIDALESWRVTPTTTGYRVDRPAEIWRIAAEIGLQRRWLTTTTCGASAIVLGPAGG
jgi:hypothetical protein